MEDPWRRFWFVLALMGWIAALLPTMVSKLTWGTLGEWVAGFATVAAVWVSLRTARHSGDLAVRIADEDRKERREAERQASIRLLKSLLVIVINGLSTMTRANNSFAKFGADKMVYAKIFLSMPGLAMVSDGLAQIRIEQLPTTTSVDLFMSARAAWMNVVTEVTEVATDPANCAVAEELARLVKLEQVADALADEIVKLGGRGDTYEDVGVQLRIAMAESRAREADPQ